MPSYEIHCQECQQKLGSTYGMVHRWLDAFAAQYHGSKKHRALRHNEDGINYVTKRWGPVAGQAAIIHIERDFSENTNDIVRNFSLLRRR